MPDDHDRDRGAEDDTDSKSEFSKKEEQEEEYEEQQEHLGHRNSDARESNDSRAVRAKFITPLDPVVVTEDGGRLPVVPVEEAKKLNALKQEVDGIPAHRGHPRDSHASNSVEAEKQRDDFEAPLQDAIPPSQTNPLFPPLPLYGPPSTLRSMQVFLFRVISSPLSVGFMLCIVAGAFFTSITNMIYNVWHFAQFENPRAKRPFHDEEVQRRKERKAAEKAWTTKRQGRGTDTPSGEKGLDSDQDEEFIPTEGGPDPLCVDIGYYARRVGLDAELFEVQTEDGFTIELFHLYNPLEYRDPPHPARKIDSMDLFSTNPRASTFTASQPLPEGNKKYPVLLMHGLLQSAGAFCANDDDSLAFYLAKSGYDVWLGNNRCGFHPTHELLSPTDPRMWAWNIRQMGVLDLPALVDRVLAETGFPQLALIAHSQGTTQTFVALAKEQRPDLGRKISVFCALAPAVYAGPLISKIYFKVMRLISPGAFRLVFGIHAFCSFMMSAHRWMPARFYGWMGYHVFSHLFSWTDVRWERDLRNRMFQWAPTYVSAESMRWWLGRECFAMQRCILSTREANAVEDEEDAEDEAEGKVEGLQSRDTEYMHDGKDRGRFAWYDEQFPPLALWVCDKDDLVDGRRLLRRFERGREPHVEVVHQKVVEGYEHLDVIWAIDSVERVAKEVREVIWRTVAKESRERCRVPVHCGDAAQEKKEEG